VEKDIELLLKEYKDTKSQTKIKQGNIKKTAGGFCFLFGFSIIASLIATYFIEKNITTFFSSLGKLDQATFYFLAVAFFMIIEGIGFYKDAFVNNNKTFIESRVSIKIKMKYSLIKFKDEYLYVAKNLFPYILLFTTGMIYLYLPSKIEFLLKQKHSIFVCFHAIIIFFLFYEVNKGITSVIEILKQSVTDSKDRLSIVLTIVATIVSVIALFK
jgi:hypothetical protein